MEIKKSQLFTLAFPQSEGWVLVAALKEYAETHKSAANSDKWKSWAIELDHELRNG